MHYQQRVLTDISMTSVLMSLRPRSQALLLMKSTKNLRIISFIVAELVYKSNITRHQSHFKTVCVNVGDGGLKTELYYAKIIIINFMINNLTEINLTEFSSQDCSEPTSVFRKLLYFPYGSSIKIHTGGIVVIYVFVLSISQS